MTSYFRLIISLILIFAWTHAAGAAVEHPFLIVKQSDYPALQGKATQTPWSEWKTTAMGVIENFKYPASGDIRDKTESIRSISGATALMYIIDPKNRATYKTKFVSAMNNWGDLIDTANNANGNAECVFTGTAFFESVLALDIFYNDLTTTERAAVENKLQQYLTTKGLNGNNWLDQCSWSQNTYAAKGIWALYKGYDASGYITSYKNELYDYISGSGVYIEGGLYAGTRMDHPFKEAKAYFLDVIEFTKSGSFRFYSDDRLKNFYEWLYGYAVTPNKKNYFVFGDTIPRESHLVGKGAAPYRAYRFSPAAAGYAAWAKSGSYTTDTGALLHYVLEGQSLPAQLKPESRIFPDGGAWFLEGSLATEKSLGGALWNVNKETFHTHYETNAMALAAYGETVLTNIGAAYGWMSLQDLKLSTIERTKNAEGGNAVLIDGINHISVNGGGITEGITAPLFDYASGDSGSALPNGKHIRNFVFVHPQDGRNGYWIVFDEVSASFGTTVKVALHPNSDSSTTVSDKMEYRWKINKNLADPASNVYMNIFLGTAPASAIMKDGIKAADLNYNFISKYLYSTYNLVSRKKNIVTVLYPSDPAHGKAKMNRISGSGYSGASIDSGGSVIDVALESSGVSSVTYNGVSFKGLAAWYRSNSGVVSSFFVRGGSSFNDPAKGYGFLSNKNIAIYMKGSSGNIISPGTEVTLYYPNVQSVRIDGIQVSPISAGTNWIKVSVASGTHSVELATGVSTAAAIPVFSPYPGTYDTAQSVTLSSATDGATIRYTTDGTTPTETSFQYSAPIPISKNTTIKARAWKTGLLPSAIATAKYTISPPVLNSITISPQFAPVVIGDTSKFTAYPEDQFGNPMTATVTWKSSNISVGTITTSGIFTALREGTATITAASGPITGTAKVSVTASQPFINKIVNPGFESGTISWMFYTDGDGWFDASPPAYEGKNASWIYLKSSGKNVQLYQNEIPLEPNTMYRLSFAAYSTDGNDLTVNLIKHTSPYTNYGLKSTYDLGTNWAPFATEFTTSGFTGTVNDGRLMFWLSSFAASGDTYGIDDIRLEKVIEPVIIIQPMPQTVEVGQAATFSVVADGTEPLSYQWQKNGIDIPGATTSVYTTPAITLQDNGSTYSVSVTNPAGTVTSNAATLMLISPNLIANSGFESGTNPWMFYTDGEGTFNTAAPGYEGNNAARLVFSSGGKNIQLYQEGITLEPDTRYRLSFAAYSTSGDDLAVVLLKHGSPNTNYGLKTTYDLQTNWQTFTTEFTTGGFTDTVNDGRLMFWFASFAAAGDTYIIDNVRLEKV